ncbi:FAD-dependent oxidoreductase [Paenibacillus sp. N3.4]|uniref:FAD-dependent oxidoreductase n=1 Tax=Paenibacillus sp. N3.4 TaxID=2603222 RepID=UPI0011C8CB2C|nr:FAD-dependent oxidoreductase [Paenibacillus sp. N3.4]TXK84545.1 FAD-dependent oxidoreductase [Paenibacillus sp. N3.4]
MMNETWEGSMGQVGHDYDVIVVGAGVGGICAALATARMRSKVLLIEQMNEIGGTGVHSAVSLVCKFRDYSGRVINNGIHRELFPSAYRHIGLFGEEEMVPTYDEGELKATYEALLEAETTLTVWTGTTVKRVYVEDGTIESLLLDGNRQEIVRGVVFLDATADGNLSALAGAEYRIGRELDGRMQSATVTFKLSGFDPELLRIPAFTTWGGIRSLRQELTVIYQRMKEEGRTSNTRLSVLCFPYPDGKALLFNSTAVTEVDPTSEDLIKSGMKEGIKQAGELVEAIRQHPAFCEAQVDFMASKLGVREGRRVTGDYVLTEEDCLSAKTFDDMVAACAYELDIHDPLGGGAKLVPIGGAGYYHIPYRSIIAKGFSNLLLSSRCISGTHEAHSSYRVMSGISAIGEAAGTAAAIMVATTPKIRATYGRPISGMCCRLADSL